MEPIKNFLKYNLKLGDNLHISIRDVLIVVFVFLITSILLRSFRKLVTAKLNYSDKTKFNTVFTFVKYFIFTTVLLITFDNMGVNVTAILAASTALLVGVGLALQTFFMDIISGLFILVDKTVNVGDILELDGKVGKVTDIKLRTTRAVTIDNKVLIIPNHKYLKSSIYNWTENGVVTRESITIGVSYESDVDLVKSLLIKSLECNSSILKTPEPTVLFDDFGDNALIFKLIFTIDNSFESVLIKSDVRFEINKLFKTHNIKIPYPQREIYINK